MRDPDLEAYVQAIEAHLRADRGSEVLLSPQDFALARSWHEAGVPLATVLVGIDRALEAGRVTSLSFCRRQVEALMTATAAPGRAARPAIQAAESVPLTELAELLGTLADHLDGLAPGPGACFELALRQIREVRDLVSVAARPNWEYLRAKLGQIDAAVSAAILTALTPEDRATLEAEASRSLERLKGRVDEASLREAVARYTVHRFRERHSLPRVSLL